MIFVLRCFNERKKWINWRKPKVPKLSSQDWFTLSTRQRRWINFTQSRSILAGTFSSRNSFFCRKKSSRENLINESCFSFYSIFLRLKSQKKKIWMENWFNGKKVLNRERERVGESVCVCVREREWERERESEREREREKVNSKDVFESRNSVSLSVRWCLLLPRMDYSRILFSLFIFKKLWDWVHILSLVR